MYLLIILQQLIAAGTHIVAKSITHNIPSEIVLFFRVLLVSIIFAIWMLFNKSKVKRIEKSDYKTLLLLGLVNIPINQFLFLKSMEYTSAPHVALAYALTPAFVFIIAMFILNEKASKAKILGLSLAIGGTILVLSEKFSFASGGLTGDILALLASFSWAIYTIIGKKLTLKYGAIYTTALAMMIGFLLYIPIFLILPVHIQLEKFTLINWGQIFYLGALTSALGYAIWYYALGKTDASKVSIFNNLQPIMTAILSYFILGTGFSIEFILGGLFVIIGVFITQRS
jgi:drug/metabolite transporter (DMT)-like permease